VSMAGEVSLPMETQNLTLRVVPEVGESVAIAATVLGTPVMGLTTLLITKLLQNPSARWCLRVSRDGVVDNPSVTRIGEAPPPKEAPKAVPAPARPNDHHEELDDARSAAGNPAHDAEHVPRGGHPDGLGAHVQANLQEARASSSSPPPRRAPSSRCRSTSASWA